MMEQVLTTLFLAALDRLLPVALSQNEKRAVSETLARLAIDYAEGRVINTDELRAVEPLNLELELEEHIQRTRR